MQNMPNMQNKQSPIPKREEKLWSDIKNYQVATNNARILGTLLCPII